MLIHHSEYYVCLEISAERVMESIKQKVSDDSKLRTDFEYEKFKEVFNEEMSKEFCCLFRAHWPMAITSAKRHISHIRQ